MHVCKECPRERWVTEFLYGLRTVADEEQIREFGFKKWITIDQSTLIDVVQPVDEFVSTLGEAAAANMRYLWAVFQFFFHLSFSYIRTTASAPCIHLFCTGPAVTKVTARYLIA